MSLLKILKEKINLTMDVGLTIEIQDFLRTQDNIKDYKIESPDKRKYKITINLDTTNKSEMRSIFFELLHFIEYSIGTYYEQCPITNGIRYSLLSFMENKTGFYAEINIISSD